MTWNKNIVPIALILISALAISCGGEEKDKGGDLSRYLPENMQDIQLVRDSEIRSYDENSLWEYIDGDAEIYLIYEFREAASTYYTKDETELTIDLYRFVNPLHAYGLYSRLRPENGEIIRLGAEGFTSPMLLNFTKGEFVVRIFGYDESMETEMLMLNLAEKVEKLLPGEAAKPKEFAIFPDSGKITNTDDFYSELFLGQKFLTEVFSFDYQVGEDTVTLFMAHDSTGEKYLQWRDYAEKVKSKSDVPKDIPFVTDYSFKMNDSYYGEIIVGLKNNKLVGMSNYSQKHKEFLIDWISRLP